MKIPKHKTVELSEENIIDLESRKSSSVSNILRLGLPISMLFGLSIGIWTQNIPSGILAILMLWISISIRSIMTIFWSILDLKSNKKLIGLGIVREVTWKKTEDKRTIQSFFVEFDKNRRVFFDKEILQQKNRFIEKDQIVYLELTTSGNLLKMKTKDIPNKKQFLRKKLDRDD